MLIYKVFPAIRTKMVDAKQVKVQFDNAGGHGMSFIDDKIKSALSDPMRRGRQVGPKEAQLGQAVRTVA